MSHIILKEVALKLFQEKLLDRLGSPPPPPAGPSGEFHQVYTEWIGELSFTFRQELVLTTGEFSEMEDGNVGITVPNHFTAPVIASQEFRGAISTFLVCFS